MTPPLPELRFIRRWGAWALAAVAAFALLYRLDGLTLRQWDEARLAVNAVEMARTGRWLVTTYGFQPDLWNVKPPLMVWLQAGLIRLIGPTDWAIRLPGALAALATIALVWWFMARSLRSRLGGVLAGSVLLSALGFLGEHHGHAGDYDALLVLWLVVFSLGLFFVLENGRARHWLTVSLGLTLATLTKGIAALLCGPGVVAYCLAAGRWRKVLRAPGFWLAVGAWAAVTGGWYVLREAAGPGYLTAVWDNELGGRFAGELEKNEGPFYAYVRDLARSKFLPWIYLLPFVVPFALRHPRARARRAAWFGLCWVVGLLVVISVARTKLVWYANPLYPWLAVLIGLGGPGAARWLWTHLATPARPAAATGLRIFFVLLLLVPTIITIHHELRGITREVSGSRRHEFPELRAGYGLRALRRESAPPTPVAVVAAPGFYRALRPPTAIGGDSGYNASLRFYVLAYPRAIRVVPPAAVAALRGPGYVLTATPADSARVRRAFPNAPARLAGVISCWLWTLPTPTR